MFDLGGSNVGHLWYKNEMNLFSMPLWKGHFPVVQQNTTHFTLNLKSPHMQSFSSNLFMVSNRSSQHSSGSSCLKNEQNATLQIWSIAAESRWRLKWNSKAIIKLKKCWGATLHLLCICVAETQLHKMIRLNK